MIQVIVLSAVLILVLALMNSFLNSICGLDSSGSSGRVIEGTFTIGILYMVIIALFGSQLLSAGIPFVDQMDTYPSLTAMFKENSSLFILECTELISLTFVISLISNYLPSSFGGDGMTGTIIRSIVLVLAGVVVSNFLLSAMKETVFFSWAVTALQCFISGAALVLTPAMLIASVLQLDPNSQVVAFLAKKLPETKLGKALTTAATNSLVLVFAIMIFESQFGSIGSLVSQLPEIIISLVAPIVIMVIGLRLMIKSVSK